MVLKIEYTIIPLGYKFEGKICDQSILFLGYIMCLNLTIFNSNTTKKIMKFLAKSKILRFCSIMWQPGYKW